MFCAESMFCVAIFDDAFNFHTFVMICAININQSTNLHKTLPIEVNRRFQKILRFCTSNISFTQFPKFDHIKNPCGQMHRKSGSGTSIFKVVKP